MFEVLVSGLTCLLHLCEIKRFRRLSLGRGQLIQGLHAAALFLSNQSLAHLQLGHLALPHRLFARRHGDVHLLM